MQLSRERLCQCDRGEYESGAQLGWEALTPLATKLPSGRDWFVRPINGAAAASSTSTANGAAATSSNGKLQLDPAEYPVARIMVFTEHPDLIRRGGVISALKNILFVKFGHHIMLAPPAPSLLPAEGPTLHVFQHLHRPSEALDLLPYLLLPLSCGAELHALDFEDQEQLPEALQYMDEGKQREPDPALRLMLVESLLLLCTGLYGRECLRRRGAYIVVREAHLREQDEKVGLISVLPQHRDSRADQLPLVRQITEAVVRLVNILKRDESAETTRQLPHTNDQSGSAGLEGEIDVGAEAPPGKVEDEDDEDTIIEEI